MAAIKTVYCSICGTKSDRGCIQKCRACSGIPLTGTKIERWVALWRDDYSNYWIEAREATEPGQPGRKLGSPIRESSLRAAKKTAKELCSQYGAELLNLLSPLS